MHWLVNVLGVHLGIKFTCGKLKNGLNFRKDSHMTCIRGGPFTILSLSRNGFGNTYFFLYDIHTHAFLMWNIHMGDILLIPNELCHFHRAPVLCLIGLGH